MPSPASGFAARRRARFGHRQLHQARQAVGGFHERRSGRCLLIDEIDKADIEFPNDLLLELDRMEFFVYETGETMKAATRPIVLITSNNEKELPDAFLRRCFFHYIKFPDHETMNRSSTCIFPDIKKRLSKRRCASSSTCARCRDSRRSPRHRNCSIG